MTREHEVEHEDQGALQVGVSRDTVTDSDGGEEIVTVKVVKNDTEQDQTDSRSFHQSPVLVMTRDELSSINLLPKTKRFC